MAILLRNQAVIAPSPGPTTFTLPVASSTVATEVLAAVYLAQRVTSLTEPSLKCAFTAIACSSPGLSVTCGGTTSMRTMRASESAGGGAPSAIQPERTRNSSESGENLTPPLCGTTPVGFWSSRLAD